MLKQLEWSAAPKFGDWVFECGEVLFRAAVCDHGDEDDLEFAVCFEFFTFEFVLTDGFRKLNGSESSRVGWRSAGVVGCCEGSSGGGDGDVFDVSDDETEEAEDGIRGGDGHCLVLNAFLKCFEGLAVWFLSGGCDLGHILEFEREKG